MIILLDMDGPMAMYMESAVRQYNHLSGENIKVKDLKNKSLQKSVKKPYLIERIVNAPGFMRSLEPTPGAIEGVNKLHNDGHKILFVSKGSHCPTSGHEKRDWLLYYFNNLWRKAPLILANEKEYVRGHCLLDDMVKNLQNLWEDCTPLLFDAAYNRNDKGCHRIHNWKEFLKWVEENK